MSEYKMYRVEIGIKMVSGGFKGDKGLSFGSMEGSVRPVKKWKFRTPDNVFEMMQDEKNYIAFTNVSWPDDDRSQYFFYKADILHVGQEEI